MDFLDSINEFADSLSNASSWHNSKEAIAIFNPEIEKVETPDYIYEFYCICSILDLFDPNLSKNFVLVKRKWGETFLLPKKPGLKKNFSRIEIFDPTNNQCIVQICCGTKIKGIADENRCPDISFQTGDSPINPSLEDVLFIHDAKFVEGGDCIDRISISQFSYFTQMVRDLGLNGHNFSGVSIGLATDFINNCILTNGKAYKENPQYHSKNHVRCVECFNEGSKYRVVG